MTRTNPAAVYPNFIENTKFLTFENLNIYGINSLKATLSYYMYMYMYIVFTYYDYSNINIDSKY